MSTFGKFTIISYNLLEMKYEEWIQVSLDSSNAEALWLPDFLWFFMRMGRYDGAPR